MYDCTGGRCRGTHLYLGLTGNNASNASSGSSGGGGEGALGVHGGGRLDMLGVDGSGSDAGRGAAPPDARGRGEGAGGCGRFGAPGMSGRAGSSGAACMPGIHESGGSGGGSRPWPAPGTSGRGDAQGAVTGSSSTTGLASSHLPPPWLLSKQGIPVNDTLQVGHQNRATLFLRRVASRPGLWKTRVPAPRLPTYPKTHVPSK